MRDPGGIRRQARLPPTTVVARPRGCTNGINLVVGEDAKERRPHVFINCKLISTEKDDIKSTVEPFLKNIGLDCFINIFNGKLYT